MPAGMISYSKVLSPAFFTLFKERVLWIFRRAHKDGKRLGMKGTCKCEPTACKCGKRRQQQQQQLKLLLSQLRRRDNLSSVILF
ncbi:uncharacterized protein LOC108162007 isoform X2 [Drosophila miranda]|uniref:uncharacterized protein LOC108162007 isoform X2 n=1 Tax=Drosophila miranda TaxID=7229 RepID=UPI00143F8844|nr:uncharacterized protein LOC108162007 isoform X2 [Drosophila miranda]